MVGTTDLQRLPVFRDCQRPALESFRILAPPISFPAGTVLLRQGDPALGAFMLVSGRCRVDLESEGRRATIGHIGPGEIAGELGLFVRDARRSASVIAEDDIEAVVLTAQLFGEASIRDPMARLERRAMATLAERVRTSTGTWRRNGERLQAKSEEDDGGIFGRIRKLWGGG